jgi:hypothetical protein
MWPLLALLAFAVSHTYLYFRLLHLKALVHSDTPSELHRHLQAGSAAQQTAAGSYSHQATYKLGTAAMMILDMLIAAGIGLLSTALAWSLYKATLFFQIPLPAQEAAVPAVAGTTTSAAPAATTGACPDSVV